jgi:hypothetical protein
MVAVAFMAAWIQAIEYALKPAPAGGLVELGIGKSGFLGGFRFFTFLLLGHGNRSLPACLK